MLTILTAIGGRKPIIWATLVVALLLAAYGAVKAIERRGAQKLQVKIHERTIQGYQARQAIDESVDADPLDTVRERLRGDATENGGS